MHGVNTHNYSSQNGEFYNRLSDYFYNSISNINHALNNIREDIK